jgi:hypothetical protein
MDENKQEQMVSIIVPVAWVFMASLKKNGI